MDLNISRLKRRTKKRIKLLFKPTYHSRRKRKIIFVLSAGRCGSMSITRMFNQHPSFSAFHENIPELIALSTRYAENQHLKKDVFRELSKIFKNRFWDGEKNNILVISDHRLWNLVELLEDFFPNAIFIHLMRNPYNSIRSYMHRNWYSQIESIEPTYSHAKHRIQGNKIGEFSDRKWRSLSRLEKCAWYWQFINLSIEMQLKTLMMENSYVIKLESIETDLNKFLVENFPDTPELFIKNEIVNVKNNDAVDIGFISDEQIRQAFQSLDYHSANFYSL